LGSPVDPDRDPQRFEEMQQGVLTSSAAVAQACLSSQTRLVHVGTCEVYGDGPTPFSEDQALRPVSPYSAAKAAADLWIQTLMRTQGLKASIARPFLSYGPGQRSGALIPTAIQAALHGAPFPMTQGTQTRELNYVSDMAQALTLAAAPAAIGQTLNLCCGQEHTVREIVERIYHLAGANPALVQVGALPHRAGESQRFFGDPSRIQALGYKPQVSLDQGLMACIQAARL
jgi:dTDP-glucose 4,6-dehydratase